MRRFRVACDLGGRQGVFQVYAGHPAPREHPLRYQAAWLRETCGCSLTPEALLAFGRLWELAQGRGVPFAELCESAFTPPGPA